MRAIYLAVILLTSFVCLGQTQGNAPIPDFWIGTWTNITQTDTISITSEKITWTSRFIEFGVYVSYVDYILHNDSTMFSFYAYPNVWVLSLEKISRVKIIFHAQTQEGYLRSNDIYLKSGTRAN